MGKDKFIHTFMQHPVMIYRCDAAATDQTTQTKLLYYLRYISMEADQT